MLLTYQQNEAFNYKAECGFGRHCFGGGEGDSGSPKGSSPEAILKVSLQRERERRSSCVNYGQIKTSGEGELPLGQSH